MRVAQCVTLLCERIVLISYFPFSLAHSPDIVEVFISDKTFSHDLWSQNSGMKLHTNTHTHSCTQRYKSMLKHPHKHVHSLTQKHMMKNTTCTTA